MRFIKAALLAVLATAAVVPCNSYTLNNINSGWGSVSVTTLKRLKQQQEQHVSTKLYMVGEIEAALSSLPLFLGPAAALAAGQASLAQKKLLEAEVEFATTELEEVKRKLKNTDTLINGSFGLAVVSAGFVAAQTIGGGVQVPEGFLPPKELTLPSSSEQSAFASIEKSPTITALKKMDTTKIETKAPITDDATYDSLYRSLESAGKAVGDTMESKKSELTLEVKPEAKVETNKLVETKLETKKVVDNASSKVETKTPEIKVETSKAIDQGSSKVEIKAPETKIETNKAIASKVETKTPEMKVETSKAIDQGSSKVEIKVPETKMETNKAIEQSSSKVETKTPEMKVETSKAIDQGSSKVEIKVPETKMETNKAIEQASSKVVTKAEADKAVDQVSSKVETITSEVKAETNKVVDPVSTKAENKIQETKVLEIKPEANKVVEQVPSKAETKTDAAKSEEKVAITDSTKKVVESTAQATTKSEQKSELDIKGGDSTYDSVFRSLESAGKAVDTTAQAQAPLVAAITTKELIVDKIKSDTLPAPAIAALEKGGAPITKDKVGDLTVKAASDDKVSSASNSDTKKEMVDDEKPKPVPTVDIKPLVTELTEKSTVKAVDKSADDVTKTTSTSSKDKAEDTSDKTTADSSSYDSLFKKIEAAGKDPVSSTKPAEIKIDPLPSKEAISGLTSTKAIETKAETPQPNVITSDATLTKPSEIKNEPTPAKDIVVGTVASEAEKNDVIRMETPESSKVLPITITPKAPATTSNDNKDTDSGPVNGVYMKEMVPALRALQNPSTSVKDYKVPSFTTPDLKMPNMNMPDLKVPEISLPSIDTSSLVLPSMNDVPFAAKAVGAAAVGAAVVAASLSIIGGSEEETSTTTMPIGAKKKDSSYLEGLSRSSTTLPNKANGSAPGSTNYLNNLEANSVSPSPAFDFTPKSASTGNPTPRPPNEPPNMESRTNVVKPVVTAVQQSDVSPNFSFAPNPISRQQDMDGRSPPPQQYNDNIPPKPTRREDSNEPKTPPFNFFQKAFDTSKNVVNSDKDNSSKRVEVTKKPEPPMGEGNQAVPPGVNGGNNKFDWNSNVDGGYTWRDPVPPPPPRTGLSSYLDNLNTNKEMSTNDGPGSYNSYLDAMNRPRTVNTEEQQPWSVQPNGSLGTSMSPDQQFPNNANQSPKPFNKIPRTGSYIDTL